MISKPHMDLVVVVPVGPNDDPSDTINSIQCYMTESRKVIVVDDSNDETMNRMIGGLGDEIDIIKAGPYPGGWGGLWVKLAEGYSYAFENYNFNVLLRIDCDGLVIASGAEEEAGLFFVHHPDTAIIGSYKIDCNGDTRDFRPPARVVLFEASPFGLRNPKLWSSLRALLALAKKHDYVRGEHCLGGANFQSYRSVKSMYEAGYLGMKEFGASRLGEDQIFALIARALGYQLGDFATGSLPLGLRYRGLPDSPENLLARHKKIVHSVRFWEDRDESAIRQFFAVKRTEGRAGRAV
jgi:hypothetical protein